MKGMQKMKAIKIAFALAAVLAMSSTGWAGKPMVVARGCPAT